MKKSLALLLAVCLAGSALADDSVQTSTLHFADAAKPGTIRITLMHGSVRLRGTDSPDVVVHSNEHLASEHRADGLRVIGASNGLEVSQHDNVIVLEARSVRHGDAVFDIDLPRQSSVAITTYTGRIRCSNISGDVDVHSMSGSITLNHLSGGATVEANNGAVRADFDSLRAGHPLSLSSLNGEVILMLPPDAKANLQLRTQNGTILTDYSEQQLVTSQVAQSQDDKGRKAFKKDGDDDDDDDGDSAQAIRDVARQAARQAQMAIRDAAQEAREGLAEAGFDFPPLPPLPPMTGGKTVAGVLNGGGVEVQITTLNGDVTVRKTSDKQ